MDGNLSLTDFIAIHKYFAVYCVWAKGLLTPWNLGTLPGWNLWKSWLKLEILKSFRKSKDFEISYKIFSVINPSVQALHDTVLTHKHGADLSRAGSLEWAHNICVVCPKCVGPWQTFPHSQASPQPYIADMHCAWDTPHTYACTANLMQLQVHLVRLAIPCSASIPSLT